MCSRVIRAMCVLPDRPYCYPLTISDFASRYLLMCEALSTTQEKFAFTALSATERQALLEFLNGI